jgi:hypothetical protein
MFDINLDHRPAYTGMLSDSPWNTQTTDQMQSIENNAAFLSAFTYSRRA